LKTLLNPKQLTWHCCCLCDCFNQCFLDLRHHTEIVRGRSVHFWANCGHALCHSACCTSRSCCGATWWMARRSPTMAVIQFISADDRCWTTIVKCRRSRPPEDGASQLRMHVIWSLLHAGVGMVGMGWCLCAGAVLGASAPSPVRGQAPRWNFSEHNWTSGMKICDYMLALRQQLHFW